MERPAIDKDVPLPPRRFDGSHPFSILRELELGDSVFFRGVLGSTQAYQVLSNRAAYLKRSRGVVLTMRSVIEKGHRGVRVWRI
jgi:hypothetical protein|tara:strand:- start:1325 stop:1576 length:252 start_codon:yes stop_codon:yes gene_type:complete